MWRVWGKKLEVSGEDLGTYTPAKFPRNVVLKGIRTWFMFYNDPTFTDITLKIYNDKNILLATSTNVVTKIEVVNVEIHALKEVYFNFDLPSFKAGENYRIRAELSAYTFDESSMVAWVRAFPAPVNRTGLTIAYKNLLKFPFETVFIGDDL